MDSAPEHPHALDDAALRALADYAAALLHAGIQAAPLSPEVAARWSPYHRLLGPDTPGGPLVTTIFDAIGGGTGAAPAVQPPVPLMLSRAALFPLAPAEARRTADRDEAEPALAATLRRALTAPPEQAHLACEPIVACLQRFGTNLPATIAVPGLSLFRQFALVSALFAASGGGSEPATRFLLVGSDTPGIQRFIGGSHLSKGAAKGLRGRSVFLQLLTDAVARRLLDRLRLPRTNLLYGAGGNLLLLAPVGCEGILREVRRDLSLALLERTGGALDQALAWTEIAAATIAGDTGPRLAALRRLLGEEKRRPYGDILADDGRYAQVFAVQRSREQIEVEATQDEDGDYPRLAEQVGAREVERRGLFLHRHRADLPASAPAWQRTLHAVSGGWRYAFDGTPRPPEAPPDHLADAINRPERAPAETTGFRFLGVTTPRDPDGTIRELQAIAAATPMGRIGVLRMDVDSLGAIFGRGLRPASLANVCTLSAALDLFFAGWLNELCRRVQREERGELAGSAAADRGDLLYTIYSGGDDLFVVGAWDRLPVLADAIRRDFVAYCADNPALHVSAGIAIEDFHFPIYQLAERAAGALDAAKALRHPTDGREKDALSLFGQVVPWGRTTRCGESWPA